MSASEVIETIKHLPTTEQRLVVEFVRALEFDDWDRQIEADDSAGKLEFLKEDARRAVKEKRLKPLP
jgi:hypothetical protein